MADINSNLPVNETSAGTPGSATPTVADQVAGTDGTNLRTISVDTAGKVNINTVAGTVTVQGPSGVAGTPSGGILTVQGVSGGQAVPTTTNRFSLTAASPAAATVGITSASALVTNASRKGLVIINVSINRVSLGIGVAAVLNSGITLLPGGVWNMDEYSFSTAAINAIASLAGSVISIQEFS